MLTFIDLNKWLTLHLFVMFVLKNGGLLCMPPPKKTENNHKQYL